MTRSTMQRLRPASALLALLALTAGLAACGGGGGQELAFTLTTEGEESKLTGPSSADAGEAQVTLTNETDEDGELQLVRVEGDHSAADVIDALGGAQEGKPLPDWFFAAGGVGVTGPDEETSATQVLEPGTYYAFDLEQGEPDANAVPAVEVIGDASDEALEGDATVTAEEYEFQAEGLSSGESEVLFDNIGKEPHHLLIAPLQGDATVEDVETFFKTEKGKPPISEEGSFDSAVIEGGESQLVDLDLEPGRYAFFCFISDREGGPPHALKGMIDEIEVK